MIYPIDVNKRVNSARSISGQDKRGVIISSFLLGNVVMFVILRTLFVQFLGLGTGAALAVQGIILCVVGVFLFRFFIFDERARMAEYQAADLDNFSRFLAVRDAVRTKEIKGRKITFFEYADGTSFVAFALRFGSNDKAKSLSTEETLTKVLNDIAGLGLETRITNMPENFAVSPEFKRRVREVNDIEDRQLQKCMLEITDAVLQNALAESNCDITYLIVRTASGYQNDDLEFAVALLLDRLSGSVTAYRSIEPLDTAGLLDYYREFYTVDAIDLAMLRTMENAETIDDTGMVRLYGVADGEGMFRSRTAFTIKTGERRLADD